MAGRIIWTLKAEKDLLGILEYWVDRTQSFTYSKKLNKLFKENIKLLSQYPHIGRITDDNNIRIKIIGNYLLFYEVIEIHIIILKIWDSRQNPKSLELNKDLK